MEKGLQQQGAIGCCRRLQLAEAGPLEILQYHLLRDLRCIDGEIFPVVPGLLHCPAESGGTFLAVLRRGIDRIQKTCPTRVNKSEFRHYRAIVEAVSSKLIFDIVGVIAVAIAFQWRFPERLEFLCPDRDDI